eukprot:4622067-Alexandrium_andersonii.AAC.1
MKPGLRPMSEIEARRRLSLASSVGLHPAGLHSTLSNDYPGKGARTDTDIDTGSGGHRGEGRGTDT